MAKIGQSQVYEHLCTSHVNPYLPTHTMFLFTIMTLSAMWYKFANFNKLELMGPTGPNSSFCEGPAAARTQRLALLAPIPDLKDMNWRNNIAMQ